MSKIKSDVKIIGKAKQPKKVDPTHSQLCKAITNYMRTKHPGRLFIHIPNEGKRSPQQGKKLKDEGLTAGVYDYFLAFVKMTYNAGNLASVEPGLWIEVKAKKDRLSKAQKEFRERAIKAHYSVLEVHSIDEFIKEIEEYLT